MGTRFISYRVIIPSEMANLLTKATFFALICISFSNAGDITDLIEDCGSRGVVTKVEMDNCDQDFDDECVVKYGESALGKLYFTSYRIPDQRQSRRRSRHSGRASIYRSDLKIHNINIF